LFKDDFWFKRFLIFGSVQSGFIVASKVLLLTVFQFSQFNLETIQALFEIIFFIFELTTFAFKDKL